MAGVRALRSLSSCSTAANRCSRCLSGSLLSASSHNESFANMLLNHEVRSVLAALLFMDASMRVKRALILLVLPALRRANRGPGATLLHPYLLPEASLVNT